MKERKGSGEEGRINRWMDKRLQGTGDTEACLELSQILSHPNLILDCSDPHSTTQPGLQLSLLSMGTTGVDQAHKLMLHVK